MNSQPHIIRTSRGGRDSCFFGGGQLFFSRNHFPRGAWIGAQGVLEGGGGDSWIGARECLCVATDEEQYQITAGEFITANKPVGFGCTGVRFRDELALQR